MNSQISTVSLRIETVHPFCLIGSILTATCYRSQGSLIFLIRPVILRYRWEIKQVFVPNDAVPITSSELRYPYHSLGLASNPLGRWEAQVVEAIPHIARRGVT